MYEGETLFHRITGIPSTRQCPQCHGSGQGPLHTTCDTCKGQGKVLVGDAEKLRRQGYQLTRVID